MKLKSFSIITLAYLVIQTQTQAQTTWSAGTTYPNNMFLTPSSANVGIGLSYDWGFSYRFLVVGTPTSWTSRFTGAVGTTYSYIDLSTNQNLTSLELGTGGGPTSQIDFKSQTYLNGDYRGRLKYTEGVGFAFQTNGSATDRMVITTSGTVGIGIVPTGPVQLQVEGFSSKFSYGTANIGIVPAAGQIDLTGPYSATSIDFKGLSNAGSDFWGRLLYTDGTGFDFLTVNNSTPKVRIKEDGKVVIGDPNNITTPGNYMLYVDNGIMTEKIKVALTTDGTNWSDYVFAPDYKLLSLDSVELFTKANCHLPGMPSADEVYAEGIDVAAMDAMLLKQIEELWLQLFLLKKENQELKNLLIEEKQK